MKRAVVKALVCFCVIVQVSFAGIILQDDFSTAPLSNGWSSCGVTPDVSEIITDDGRTVLHMKRTSNNGVQDSGYSRTIDVASDQQYLTVLCHFRSMAGATNNGRDLILDENFANGDGNTNYLRFMLAPWADNDVQVWGMFSGTVCLSDFISDSTIDSAVYYWAVMEVGPSYTRLMLLDDVGEIIGQTNSFSITIASFRGKTITMNMIMCPQYTGNMTELAVDDYMVLYDAFSTVAVSEPTTQAPVFSPAGPSMTSSSTTVTISSGTSGASIYYTTDGSLPTTNGTAHLNPTTVTVTDGMTLRAIAVKTDTSCLTSRKYTCANPGIVFQDNFSIAPLSNGWSADGVTPDVSEITTDDNGSRTVLHMSRTSTNGVEVSGYSRTINVASDQQYLTVLCNFRSMAGPATNGRDLILDESFDGINNLLRYMLAPWADNDVQVCALVSGTFCLSDFLSCTTVSSSQYYWAVTEMGPSSTRMMLLDDNGNVVSQLSTSAITISTFAGKNITLDMYMSPQYTGNMTELAVDEIMVLYKAFSTIDIPTPTTQAPVFSPAGPSIKGPTTVTISSGTSGAGIYYTTDGTMPTTSGTAYSNPTDVMVTEGMTLRAMAKGTDTSCLTSQTYVYSNTGIMFHDDFSTMPLSNGWSSNGATPNVSEITTDGTRTVLHMKRTSTYDAQSSGYTRTFDIADNQQYLTILCNFRSMAASNSARDLALTLTYKKEDGTIGDLCYMLGPWADNDVYVATYSGSYGNFMGGTIASNAYYWAVVEIGPSSTRTMLLDDSGNVVGQLSDVPVTISSIAGKSISLDMDMIPQITGATAEVAINDFMVLYKPFTAIGITEPATAAPVFNPSSSTITGPTTVTIGSATSGASIYYTTDGSLPTTKGTAYLNQTTVTVTNGMTLRAIALGTDISELTTQTYAYAEVSAPTFSPAGPYISGPTTIAISSTTQGASIYYTTDGKTTPTAATGTRYTGPVMVNGGEKLQAIAATVVTGGYNESSVTSMTYESNPVKAELTRGHYLLVDRGLQIQALTFPLVNGQIVFSMDTFNQSNFTGMNTWAFALDPAWFGGAATPQWGRWYETGKTPDTLNATELAYLDQLVSFQYRDEQAITNAEYVSDITDWIALNKVRYPNVISYANQYGGQNTLNELKTFVQAVQPDMVMFDTYAFDGDTTGGSPTDLYESMQKYRQVGLAGLTGDGSKPIPYALYLQMYTDNGMQHVVSDSEMRLNQFAAWAFGFKFAEGFLYTAANTELLSVLFDGMGDTTPKDKFYQVAETNRQSRNLGPALIRLISTDVRMVMGEHNEKAQTWYEKLVGQYHNETVTNDTPGGITTGLPGTDTYLTGASATNPGSKNDGLKGDVVIGFFKPLHESFDGDQYTNEKYFMVTNGLSDGSGSASETCQTIHLTFNFGSSTINSLQRLSRTTGHVEIVPLTSDGTGGYYVDITLDGGTGDLFKYNTGAPFVGVDSTSITGDFNNDGKINATDIDLLSAAIKTPNPDSKFDLTGEGLVNSADMDVLVKDILKTYYGDADLNRSVGVSDLSVLAAYYNTASGASWANGDFDGNGAVGVSDLSILAANYNSGSASTISWAEAYAQAFGTTSDADETTDASADDSEDTTSSVCSSLGLSLIAGLTMLGLAIVKLEE
jgi:hypothetical protein